MEIGSVFRWRNYPKQKDGKLKSRWFIYLGLSSILSNPQNVFLLPSTTQKELYESNGRRRNHKNIITFKQGQFGFKYESIVDLNFFKNDWTLSEFNNYTSKITKKGEVDHSHLKQLYDLICKCCFIPKIIIKDIRRNLNGIGIFNLKIPK